MEIKNTEKSYMFEDLKDPDIILELPKRSGRVSFSTQENFIFTVAL